MKKILCQIVLCFTLIAVLISCSRKPKVIAPSESIETEKSAEVFPHEHLPSVINESSELASDIHTVTVLEVLPTVRYVYLRVSEEHDEFWIATLKREVTVGGVYFYQGGLLKTNFQSREHRRVFDRMFLVSSIIEAEHSQASKEETSTGSTRVLISNAGTTRIADLVREPAKYEGKVIQVMGECVKVNPNIMGRNWIHLQDRSANDFDLVVTSNAEVPVGRLVKMTGRVVLNRDFGSGYHYSILLEDGELLQ